MLYLRPMQENTLADYLAFVVEEYAKDIAANYDLPLEKAHQVAQTQISARLSQGINTPDNYIYHIERVEKGEHEPIGYLWYSIDREEGYAFLDAIDLFTPFQNQGYGGEVLALAEEQLTAEGIRSMSLHVSGTNQRAQRFYQRHGYLITGYNMKKNW